jgi:hypothetical protein
MARRIGFSEVEQAPRSNAYSAGSSAALLEEATVTLRFRLTSTDDVSLEAIRYARRGMLREEWTRGEVEGEPSLEDAVFSPFEVVWEVPAEHGARCRAKLEELVARANRALADASASRRP